MSEQDHDTSELAEAEEVLGMMFPARLQAVEVVQPSQEPLDLPAPSIAAQHPPILGGDPHPIALVRGDRLNARARKTFIERIASAAAVQ